MNVAKTMMLTVLVISMTMLAWTSHAEESLIPKEMVYVGHGPSMMGMDKGEPAYHLHPESAKAVHQTEHDVDRAWEIYHCAALGGTIASPALQAEIEQHLHEARTLVTRAQEAAERGNRRQVKRLVGEIKIHTSQAIEGSKEQKK